MLGFPEIDPHYAYAMHDTWTIEEAVQYAELLKSTPKITRLSILPWPNVERERQNITPKFMVASQ